MIFTAKEISLQAYEYLDAFEENSESYLLVKRYIQEFSKQVHKLTRFSSSPEKLFYAYCCKKADEMHDSNFELSFAFMALATACYSIVQNKIISLKLELDEMRGESK